MGRIDYIKAFRQGVLDAVETGELSVGMTYTGDQAMNEAYDLGANAGEYIYVVKQGIKGVLMSALDLCKIVVGEPEDDEDDEDDDGPETQLVSYMSATFNELLETHLDLIDSTLGEELEGLHDEYEALKGRDITEAVKFSATILFQRASDQMGNHSLWNERGQGYEALKLLRETSERTSTVVDNASASSPARRDGYIIGGASVCYECLHDDEVPENQTAHQVGERYSCSRCSEEFVVPA